MPLPPETILGRYKIISLIGSGGMGEVYLAHDTTLQRKVALKVLPRDVATNQDRLRRFKQEATAAASLNHPNIAHIYEIGEAEGFHFIAMEYVDGQTFRERILDPHEDLSRLLRILQHVAEGLAKAHAAGIVHRDLKPDNIMVSAALRNRSPRVLQPAKKRRRCGCRKRLKRRVVFPPVRRRIQCRLARRARSSSSTESSGTSRRRCKVLLTT